MPDRKNRAGSGTSADKKSPGKEDVMISILSPAKTLDYETHLPTEVSTQPAFLDESQKLIETLRAFEQKDIEALMGVSEKIAELNVERYKSFELPFTSENARPAIFAFKGDVYRDLELNEYSESDLSFTQAHVRILSGLYGVLRPLDLMQPYRLEMGTKLKTSRGNDLYAFWGAKISQHLNDALKEQGDDLLINLASDEYFKSVDTGTLKAKIIKVNFLDLKKGKYKIVSFYAKRARGMMTNFICRNHINTVEGLKDFNTAGYYFDENQSSASELFFLRDKPE